MTDRLTKERRSWNMGQIGCKDTKPEILVRSILHRNGYRFRLHKRNLPGKPDIVLTRYRTIIFVNGCFWHRHQDCPDATIPKTRTDFWTLKLSKNVERDKKVQKALCMKISGKQKKVKKYGFKLLLLQFIMNKKL